MAFCRTRNVSDREFPSARMAHILQLLAVIAVNTGIWTATFALLTLIMVRSSLVTFSDTD